MHSSSASIVNIILYYDSCVGTCGVIINNYNCEGVVISFEK